MAGHSGGPWGGGGNNGSGGGDDDRNRGGRKPGNEGSGIPEIDDLMNKGREQLRVLMGGGGRGGSNGSGGGGDGGPQITRGMLILGGLIAVGLWGLASVYTVRPEERSVELRLGQFLEIGEPGLNFAPWPIVTYEKVQVTQEQRVDIGASVSGRGSGLMLTGDENIVDIDFQVVWNIADPAQYLFNLAEPESTIRAVSESAMREIVAQSQLAPILNRDRGIIAERLRELIQQTLDSYNAGIAVLRVNFDRADPPTEVIAAFREVQEAEQQRERLQSEADAYANRVLAGARGEAAQVLEEAEGYRARVVNEAEGEASRFSAVLQEYAQAPEVTRKRLYLETMEQVLGDVDKIIVDSGVTGGAGGGQGVVPYLPLNELRGGRATQGGSN